MAFEVTLSLLEGQKVVDSVNGVEITLTGLVRNIPVLITDSVSNLTVLTRCRPALPVQYSPHPDMDNYPYATLRDVYIQSRRSFNSVIVALVYRQPGTAEFQLEEISQSEYLKTSVISQAFSTSAFALSGSPTIKQNIEVWFDKTKNNDLTVMPDDIAIGNPHRFAVDVSRFFGKRIIRASGWMTWDAWSAVRQQVNASLWSTNSSQWGDDPYADSTGSWLFQSMNNVTRDKNHTKEIQLYFIQQPGGHYPIAEWINAQGYHESGGTSEAAIRAMGPPPLIDFDNVSGVDRFFRSQWQMNGLTRAAVYPETEFNLTFNFDPSDC